MGGPTQKNKIPGVGIIVFKMLTSLYLNKQLSQTKNIGLQVVLRVGFVLREGQFIIITFG